MDTSPHRPSSRFGAFEFFPTLRRLERGGKAVVLSSRAINILMMLLERPGEVVSKQELLARVWPDSLVGESALRYHLFALRRALGDGEDGVRLITTAPARGYCFVGALESSPGEARIGVPPAHALPARPTKVVGRDAVVKGLLRQLETQRFVTVVGPGGIGKTTVAMLAAHDWVAKHDGAAVFADLSELDGESIPEVLCAKLGLAPNDVSPVECLIAHFRSNQALIVLDTCEGVIDAAAALAEALVGSAQGAWVLATSREAMRAAGEIVHRIEPLTAPIAGQDLTMQDSLKYPAVQLFVQRAAANNPGFALDDRQAALVGAICRQLEGIALAIELAAGRVETFGVQQVADLLATELTLSWPGRRTAAPRHQTLGATLNWSHELLGPMERAVFRRLSVFVGAVPLETVIAVCTDDGGVAVTDVTNALWSLVAKSLLHVVIEGSATRYRMLDTTRAYALSKLAESCDQRRTRLRQALHYLARLVADDAERHGPAAVAEVVANVSAALNWAFGAQGDPATGVRLIGAAAGLWVRHGLLIECRRWARVVQEPTDGDPDPSILRTRLIVANALMVTDGMGAAGRNELEAAYASARKQGELDERVSGLFVLWADEHRRCRYAAAMRLIDDADFLDAPEASHEHRLIALWVKGMTDHCAGRQTRACEHLSRLLGDYTEDAGRQFLLRFGYDLEAAAGTILGMSKFLRGNLHEAFAASDRAIAKARTLNSPVSYRAVLRWRATMMYFVDEDGLGIEHLTQEILPTEAFSYAADNKPEGTSLAIHGLWLARNGNYVQGAEMVRQGLKACIETDYLTIVSFVRAEIALQLLRHGADDQVDEFLAPLEDNDDEDDWATPEVLRSRGEIAERRGDLVLAEVRYREALALAERQDALTWRLRAAVSLADLWRAQGRADDAAALLEPIHGQFRSDTDWPLLRRAADCLYACRTSSERRASMANASLERGAQAPSSPKSGVR
jgi:predicted ATPase